MKIKTSELTGIALAHTVAVLEGAMMPLGNVKWLGERLYLCVGGDESFDNTYVEYAPHEDWSQGGPIIEREKINVVKQPLKDVWHGSIWKQGRGWTRGAGPTPLIAAMRCYVASELGDEVEIPEELA